MKRPSLLTTLTIGTLFGLSACGGPTGTETPSTTETTSSPTSTTRTTSTSASGTPLTGVDPCSLLTESQLQELGTPELTDQGKGGSARYCAHQSPIGVSPARAISVDIRDEQGLKVFQGDFVKSTIAGHTVKIHCDPDCMIGIDVTETSRIDVQASVVGDKVASKRLAKKVARMVISNLPKSN